MTNSHGGLQNLDGFVHSVNDAGSPVKGFSKRTIDTQQFKKWFGDWQNDPAKASKVVNADGTPKVVYHGTNAEVVVGITDKGESVFYDVVDIQSAIFTLEKQDPSTNVTTNESPDVVHEGSLANSIRNSSRNVNSVSDQTETENFKKWFGDWQKNPTKASKVVNEDGTPKVVYHGTNAELKAEYLKQVVQIQKKHHLPESAAFLPVTAPIRGRTGPAYRGPHGRRRRARGGR